MVPGEERADGVTAASADDEVGRATSDRVSRRRSRGNRRLAALLAWSVGCLALGGGGAYELFNRYATKSEPKVVINVERPSTPGVAPASLTMPDVEGLTREAALEALADAGLDPGAVSFDARPYVATPGSVVAQAPVRGTNDPKGIRLSLAADATMPELVGQPTDEAVAAVERLGTFADVVQIYDKATPVGRVIGSEPAAGKALSDEVTLRVSSAPSSIYLSALQPTRSGCSRDDITAGGTEYRQSLVCRLPARPGPEPMKVEYNLATRADALSATLVLADDSPTGSTAKVSILVDGKVAGSFDLAGPKAVNLESATAGGVRLEIHLTGSSSARVILGGARLLGSPDNIEALEKADS